MNALAAVETGTGLGSLTLWSSHRPCPMCAAACAFTGVGSVSFIAPDPSDDDSYQDPGGIETEWVVVAGLLFLSGVAAYSGPSSSMITRARQREPEIAGLMRTADDTALRQATLRDTLIPVWPQIQAAARERRKRRGRGSPSLAVPGSQVIARLPRMLAHAAEGAHGRVVLLKGGSPRTVQGDAVVLSDHR